MQLLNSEIFNNLGKFLLVLLFAYTGSSKLLAHELFLNQLSQIAFLKKIASPVSVILPLLEIGSGILMTFDKTKILGFWIASLLMTGFTIYIAGMLILKSSLPCTCGGVIASMTWKQHLIFNLFFMLLAWVGLYNHNRKSYENISTNKRK